MTLRFLPLYINNIIKSFLGFEIAFVPFVSIIVKKYFITKFWQQIRDILIENSKKYLNCYIHMTTEVKGEVLINLALIFESFIQILILS